MAHSLVAASGQTFQNAIGAEELAGDAGIAGGANGIDLDPVPLCGIVRVPSFADRFHDPARIASMKLTRSRPSAGERRKRRK
jgi:hypothetical protein